MTTIVDQTGTSMRTQEHVVRGSGSPEREERTAGVDYALVTLRDTLGTADRRLRNPRRFQASIT
ncbi:hypothetical protein N7510_006242 [Penicillium lagena]|uniref:uncharacterized protein n=1 Tax=Penicillium lagena TaxID=94218 RepID=UPI00253FB929|nr:uncharacterized protein N7510_006242 [Penicillium lagena]KAJ5613048.1 hypothetical protein N7510_006242 [Penicillium lagena]